MLSFNAWVYIMTNLTRSVLYVGFTTDLRRRVWQHRTKHYPNSFTARYNVKHLVYYQGFLSVSEALKAEKYIKGKNRDWKRMIIDKQNPKWIDLRDRIEEELK